uniref:Uncharacterized protein n=1 Tax=Eunotogramma sp. TaxID=2219035 RepID=A0A2U9NPW2_9STRA|nr:hypothetical protein ycf88 [Eunotogramma sp.]
MPRVELTLQFPENFQVKTFNVKSEKKLSPLAKSILQSFRYKHFYYVRDDITYLLKSNPFERDLLLQLLHSTVIFLQNNHCVNFFDIWVYEVYINEVPEFNHFINKKCQNLESSDYITIKLAYQIKSPKEKVEIPW